MTNKKATPKPAIKAAVKAPVKAPIKAPVKAAKPAPKLAPKKPVAKTPAKTPAKGTKKPTAETRTREAYCGNANAEGRNCARYQDYNGCTIPRIRPPRGVATPNGYDVSKWTQKEGKGCPAFSVKDTLNATQVTNKGEPTHTAMRSLCVAGVLSNSTVEGAAFDPAAKHCFVIENGDTFIVW